jgi:phage terminase small subunit
MALTPKQQRFIAEYLIDKNATRAAKAAGYSKKTSAKIGFENLQKPEIKSEIDKGLAKQLAATRARGERKELTRERWLEEVRLLAFSNMDNFATVKNGSVFATNTKNRPKPMGRMIKKLSETKNGIGLELHSKQAALELLGKHYGWVKDKLEHSGVDGKSLDLTVTYVSPPEKK